MNTSDAHTTFTDDSHGPVYRLEEKQPNECGGKSHRFTESVSFTDTCAMRTFVVVADPPCAVGLPADFVWILFQETKILSVHGHGLRSRETRSAVAKKSTTSDVYLLDICGISRDMCKDKYCQVVLHEPLRMEMALIRIFCLRISTKCTKKFRYIWMET